MIEKLKIVDIYDGYFKEDFKDELISYFYEIFGGKTIIIIKEFILNKNSIDSFNISYANLLILINKITIFFIYYYIYLLITIK